MMAEFIDADQVEVESAIKVTFEYEEFYLSEEAARSLRDSLNASLSGR
jgi:hypothetical protein